MTGEPPTGRPLQEGSTPLVSVIIPAGNAEAFLKESIESVLIQTYQNFEIIVVDDGSIDKTRDIASGYGRKVTYLYQEHQGVSAARNRGIRSSCGDWVAFLDADDVWLPGRLEEGVEFCKNHQDVGLVFSDVELFSAEGVVLSSFLGEKSMGPRLLGGNGIVNDAFELLLDENFISTPTVMVRRDCLNAVGLFDESLHSVEDRELWLRVAAQYRIACIPKVLCRKRCHDSNISSDRLLALQSIIKVLERVAIPSRDSNQRSSLAQRARLAAAYFALGYHYFNIGDYPQARQNFVASLSMKTQAKPVVYYLATLFDRRLRTWVQGLKRRASWR